MSCCDYFTKTKRKCVTCPACDFSACRRCYERYFLEMAQKPHCMSCRQGFLLAFLLDHFTRTFIDKRLRDRQKEIYLERERSYLPEAQTVLEDERRRDAINRRITDICKQKKELKGNLLTHRQRVGQISRENRISRRKAEAKLLSEEGIDVAQMRADMKAFDKSLEDCRLELRYGEGIVERNTFTFKCPLDECPGFLSSAWKCGICEHWVCKKCYADKGLEKDDEHVCDEDDLATAEELKKNSKPCPSCGTRISRVSGCSQMFCQSCHTPFDWNSGKIVTGVIHNPHYFEWRARNGDTARVNPVNPVNPGDPVNPCQINYNRLPDEFREPAYFVEHAEHLIRQYTHDHTTSLLRYRVDYLRKAIDETKWKQRLAKLEKQREFHTDLREILHMFCDSARGILREVQDFSANITIQSYNNSIRPRTWWDRTPRQSLPRPNGSVFAQAREHNDRAMTDLHNLREYVNETLAGICQRYKSQIKINIDEQWTRT